MKTVFKLSPPADFPPGLANANWFSFFNAISFQIFLGPPLILYAKSLGASATILGILGSLTPLLNIFQIPAAHHFHRFGYRRFVLAGWSTRNICVFAVVAVPFLTFLDNWWKLALLLGLQFVYNLLRGISCGAWLPWLTEILPDNIRARFLSRDQRFMQTGALAAFLFCGLVFQKDSQPWEFALAFFISAIGGATSLYFLNHMPDVEAQETLKNSGTSVPWGSMLSYPPFARLLIFNLLYAFTTGSTGVFCVAFLKGRLGLGESVILYLLALSFIAAVATLGIAGRLLESLGPKRLLHWAVALFMLQMGGWVGLASGTIAPRAFVLVLIFVLSGSAVSAINLANLRLMMNVMPAMGRSHFFAIYSVVTSLCLGFSPIFWGICLDAMNGFKIASSHLPFEWNRYSIYFGVLFALTGLTLLSAAALMEKHPRRMGEPQETER